VGADTKNDSFLFAMGLSVGSVCDQYVKLILH